MDAAPIFKKKTAAREYGGGKRGLNLSLAVRFARYQDPWKST